MHALVKNMKAKKSAQDEEIKVEELPFDIEKLFHLTYSFDPLKQAILQLLKGNKANDKKVNDLEMKLMTKMMLLDKLKNDATDKDKRLKTLEEKVKELEEKTEHHDQQLLQINANYDSMNMSMQLVKNDVAISKRKFRGLEESRDDHADRIEKLENQMLLVGSGGGGGGSGSGGGIDLDALNKLMSNLKGDLEREFAKKSDFDDLKERVEKLEVE